MKQKIKINILLNILVKISINVYVVTSLIFFKPFRSCAMIPINPQVAVTTEANSNQVVQANQPAKPTPFQTTLQIVSDELSKEKTPFNEDVSQEGYRIGIGLGSQVANVEYPSGRTSKTSLRRESFQEEATSVGRRTTDASFEESSTSTKNINQIIPETLAGSVSSQNLTIQRSAPRPNESLRHSQQLPLGSSSQRSVMAIHTGAGQPPPNPPNLNRSLSHARNLSSMSSRLRTRFETTLKRAVRLCCYSPQIEAYFQLHGAILAVQEPIPIILRSHLLPKVQNFIASNPTSTLGQCLDHFFEEKLALEVPNSENPRERENNQFKDEKVKLKERLQHAHMLSARISRPTFQSGNPPSNLAFEGFTFWEAMRMQQYDSRNPTWGTHLSIKELTDYICNNRLNPRVKKKILNKNFFTFHTYYELDINCFRAKEVEYQPNTGVIAASRYNVHNRPSQYELVQGKKAITPAYKAFLRACQKVLPESLIKKLRSREHGIRIEFSYS